MTQEKDKQEKPKQEKPKQESPSNELPDADLDKVSGGVVVGAKPTPEKRPGPFTYDITRYPAV